MKIEKEIVLFEKKILQNCKFVIWKENLQIANS